VEISAHQDVIGEFSMLRASLVEGPSNWMPGPYEPASANIAELSVEMPWGRLSRYARIDVGPPEVLKDEVILPISWEPLEDDDLLPVFCGELRLKRVGDGHSQLRLHGYYVPPFGIVGQVADALAMKAVAKTAVEDFVERVAGILARNALGRSVDEQVTSGRLTLD
jgi:hypothetical protein